MLPLRVVTNFVVSSLRNFDRMQPLSARGGLVLQGELVDIHDTRRRKQSEFPVELFSLVILLEVVTSDFCEGSG